MVQYDYNINDTYRLYLFTIVFKVTVLRSHDKVQYDIIVFKVTVLRSHDKVQYDYNINDTYKLNCL